MYIYKQLVISALATRFYHIYIYLPILQLNYFSTKHQQVSGIACRPTSLRSLKARCATTRRSRPCSCRDAWDCTWWPTWRWEWIGRGSRGATKTWTLWWYIYIHMYLQKYPGWNFHYTSSGLGSYVKKKSMVFTVPLGPCVLAFVVTLGHICF